jgi:hypothetical protein
VKFLSFAFAALFSFSVFAAKPVAHWDVVPYQCIAADFNAGIVAFHEKELEVEFSVNGKVVDTVSEAKLNPRTNIKEYYFTFAPSKYPDGPVTLDGKVTVKDSGEFYSLPTIMLYANSKRSLGTRRVMWVDSANGNDYAPGTRKEPLRTLKRAVSKAGDGGLVLLYPGTYSARMIGGGKNRKYWTIISSAPGVDRSQVKITSGRTGTEKLCFKRVELECAVATGYGTIIMGEGGSTSAWFDQCLFRNSVGRYSGQTTPFGNSLNAYVTGGVTEEMSFGPSCVLMRSHELRNLALCAFMPEKGMLAVDVKLSGLAPEGEGVESDMFRAFGVEGGKWIENLLFYGIRGSDLDCHVFMGSRIRNSAFVDINVETTYKSLITTQFLGAMENVLFINVQTPNQEWQWATPKNKRQIFQPKDVRLYGVKNLGFSGYDVSDGSKGLLISK